ncbi:MAG: 50S ribosomal protein L30 [Thermoplasmatota archaeon]
MVYAVVRVRGTVNVKPKITKTLELLRLTRVNHCTLVDEKKEIKGMLQQAKDYVTWGEINEETLSALLQKRGRLTGDQPLTKDFLSSATSAKTIEELSKSILDGSLHLKEIPDLKPVFRLNPPSKGFEGIKRSFVNKGALGYRGKKINDLLQRMI